MRRPVAGWKGLTYAGIAMVVGCHRGAQQARLGSQRPFPHPALVGEGAQAHSIADVAERTVASVLNISSTKVVRYEGRRGPFSDPFFRFFFNRRFFRRRAIPRERRQRSLGSGVIVDRSGIVLTNNHVIDRAERIRVLLSDGRQLEAEVVGTDPSSDLAVLRLLGQSGRLQPIAFGDSNRLRLGDVVLAIGNPFGVGQTVTMGIVSAKGRSNVGIVDYEDFIQTDAAINPGNSGGALISMDGTLVGINTAIVSRSGGYQGIGFAIPSNMARQIMRSILRHGKVVRGWLGVSIQDLTPALGKALGLAGQRGVLVSEVSAGGPAAKAGLAQGDVITHLNGESVASSAQLRNLVATSGAQQSVSVRLLRRGRSQELTVRLQAAPLGANGVKVFGAREGLLAGVEVADLNLRRRQRFRIPSRLRHGVVVQKIPASRRGMRQSGLVPGDVILRVDRQPVRDVASLRHAYRAEATQVVLLVYRRGRTFYLLLRR